MTDEPTLKQYNFLNSKGKYVEGMTKQQAHEAIALIIPAKTVPQTPTAQTEDAGADVIDMTATASSSDKPEKSYDLSDGNIRIGALNAALSNYDNQDASSEDVFWKQVKEFEEYIRNGKE